MNIIIAGAGELGRLLAAKLNRYGHDVVIVDTDSETLEHINEKLDVRVLEGSCLDVTVLKEAGIRTADAFLALSGNDAVNIVGCRLASRFGVKKTVCRLSSRECFSESDFITPESMGIWEVIEPNEECIRKILGVLDSKVVMEEIRFSHPDALICVLEMRKTSFLAGTRIKDIPAPPEILKSIRFAAIVREKDLLVPHGETLLVPGDKIYIAGHQKDVHAFIQYAAPEDNIPPHARILIGGGTETARRLAILLADKGHDVRFIHPDREFQEKLLEEAPSGLLAINGRPTDEETLEEAGVRGCYAFLCAGEDDEDNILGSLIAKRMGAEKTVSVTFKPEYIRITPTIEEINCSFSSTLVSVNAILRMLEKRTMRVDAFLQIFNANLTEFEITSRSRLCGKTIMESSLPPSLLLALLFRTGEVMVPEGSTVLEQGDVVVAITTADSERECEKFFPKE
ncbi:MAG: Trk system potassium transporter TrkA [Lentisphaeria bacterium]|nr:Trk system potassium transporter TrkA [Lentisphaeria bacterium]